MGPERDLTPATATGRWGVDSLDLGSAAWLRRDGTRLGASAAQDPWLWTNIDSMEPQQLEPVQFQQ